MIPIKLWVILMGTGIGSYIGGILLNIGNWKSYVLFVVGALFSIAQLVFFVIRQIQMYQLRKIKIREGVHVTRKRRRPKKETT